MRLNFVAPSIHHDMPIADFICANSYRCPCAKQNSKWREHYGLDNLIDKDVVCDNFRAKVPQGLIDHLEHVGGVYCKKSGQVHMKCKFHYVAIMFLEYLYNK